jgi:CubicO group peptidase (beta-lactamase class C family)
MSKSMAATLVILMLVCCTTPKVDPQLAQKIQRIENGLVEFVPGPPDAARTSQKMSLAERMAVHKIPGVSIAVIKGGRIDWGKAYGVLNADKGAPVTTESIFQAASTTKMLVAAAVLHFVGEGRLDLDRNVNDYLKSWQIPENDLSREKPVTLRLLMTHQSGLPMTNFPTDDGPPPTLVQVLKGEPPARNKPAEVEYLPGSKWQYSNIGSVVIQLVLEDLTGTRLARLMQEVIFGPLGMKSSTLVYPLESGLREREISPHDADGKACEPAMGGPALAQGGLMTTPTDLALFCIEIMRAYRGESDRVLSREMARAMLRPELDLDPALLGMPLREGLGVMLSAEGEPFSFGHPGDNYPGASSWVMAYPDLDTGIVVMTNGAKGNLLALEIMPAYTEEYVRPGRR